MTRAYLDSNGINFVQVVPVTAELLCMPLERAVQVPEPNWAEPCDGKEVTACAAPHVIIMSGVDSKEAGIIDSLLRKMGLPMMAIGRFHPDNAKQLLGDLCAEVCNSFHVILLSRILNNSLRFHGILRLRSTSANGSGCWS